MLATVVCAWCQKHLGTKNVEVPDGMPAVTHGICPDCKEKQAEEGRKLAELKTGALDAEDAFDLDELERFADERRRRDMLEMTDVQQERIFQDTCIECGKPLRWEMDSDCRFVACCNLIYSTPLLRGDLVTIQDAEGRTYE